MRDMQGSVDTRRVRHRLSSQRLKPILVHRAPGHHVVVQLGYLDLTLIPQFDRARDWMEVALAHCKRFLNDDAIRCG